MLNIVLYEPEIPQNTGNIMRSCMAFNAKLHLIEPLGFKLDEKHLRRSAMDYIKDLDYKVYPDWETFKKDHEGRFVYFTRYALKGFENCVFDKDDADTYLVFGKESTGIDKKILKDNLDDCYRIPMVPKARSLNLSNTVAIGIYEYYRQTGFDGLSDYEVLKGKYFLIDLK
ncbi:MAG: tRNA (cytidine(34)-2'-O)-methyltransferase [Erysipelotrichaceae bacterium]|nr:tRNA (cytidine(34)-2'-O)-methyltransferase [Erysipelotrichaceae bacterium]